tara:strand:- start:2896 stop:4032 length:1137 start_codon:yes stop_codon:yes gene_type:complete
MIFIIYSIAILSISLLTIDLILISIPKSKLEIIPINYELNPNKFKIEFKIINKSKRKETMVPTLDINLNYLENESLISIFNTKEIIIEDKSFRKEYKGSWKTTIIKANSYIKVSLIIKPKKEIFNKSIWLSLNWSNYGHFGLINKRNSFLLNNCDVNLNTRELIKISSNKGFETIAIKTSLLGIFDEPYKTISKYCKDIVKKGDILVIGETPLAIMQGRYIDPLNIRYTPFAKLLCYFFHPTSSLATACGMQLLINKIGISRIIFALIIGIIFKILNINGMFYRLTGVESSLIDDISGTTFPYDKSIVMGPIKTKIFCENMSRILGIDVAVADVNDLGKVKILSSSNKSIEKLLEKKLLNNPAGNDDQKTPIVLIRKI